MFKMLSFSLLFLLTSLSYADTQSICVLNEKDAVIQSLSDYIVEVEINYPENYSTNDKFKHCGGSCLLAKRCDILSSAAAGFLKELMDVFGDGNAEINDLVANIVGIRVSKYAYSEAQCLLMCQSFFPVFVESRLIGH